MDESIGGFEFMTREGERNVKIKTVGYGGDKDHQYFAIYCTNGKFIK